AGLSRLLVWRSSQRPVGEGFQLPQRGFVGLGALGKAGLKIRRYLHRLLEPFRLFVSPLSSGSVDALL
ncbi:MAG: hypothetical protein P8M78_08270, partial [Myxococcota bacterium]|nr:hypothetical protein [Myxococcota bacterium]